MDLKMIKSILMKILITIQLSIGKIYHIYHDWI